MPIYPDIIPSRRASRCLFGMPDREELQDTLRKEKEELQLHSNSKWDFDFENGIPLQSSRFNWSKVTALDSIPRAYELPHLVFSSKRKCDDLDDLVDQRASKVLVKDSDISCSDSEKPSSSRPSAQHCDISSPSTSSYRQTTSSQRQPKITDYYHIRKSKTTDDK